MPVPPLMVFAAGFGTRMGALTQDRPKPLIPVAGRCLLDHALDLAQGLGLARIVVNLHYKAYQIRQHLAGRDILFSDESDAILETGGGLRKALPLLDANPVLLLNSDAVWTGENPLRALLTAWKDNMAGLLSLVPTDRAKGHQGQGDFVMDSAGRLARGKGAGSYVYTGAQILRTDGLATISDPVFSVNLLWDEMIAKGQLFGCVHAGEWCDVGRPESLALAETLLSEQRL